MDIQTLRRNLAISNGVVNITAATVPTTKFDALFSDIFSGTTITISGAVPGPQDSGNTVQIAGTASAFRNVDGAQILATFVLDDQTGDAAADLCYTLNCSSAGDGGWTFSDSFPDLPPAADQSASPLDELALSAGWFHASTDDSTVQVPVSGQPKTVDVKAGLSFVGIFNPLPMLQPLEKLIHADAQFAIAGAIVLSGAAEQDRRADDAPEPGITLRSHLELGFQLGKALTVSDTDYQVYSPLAASRREKAASEGPQTTFSATVHVPSARDLSLDLAATLVKESSTLALSGTFTGMQLRALGELADLWGASDLLDFVPEAIRDRLGQLGLKEAHLSLTKSDTSVSAESVSLVVDMPDAPWRVGDLFEFDDLVATFSVSSPFAAGRKADASLDVTFAIDGAPIQGKAGYPNFTISADLEPGYAISLTALLEKYLPAVPAPAALSIDTLHAAVTPGKDFSLKAGMAHDPSWSFPLGPSNLVIQDVELDFTRSIGQGGDFAGSFSGELRYDRDVTLDMTYDITEPGLIVRGSFATISLSGLIQWVTNTDHVLPDGFDLRFTGSTLVLEKTSEQYSFYLGTEVSHFGSLCFELNKQGSRWGYMVGLDMHLASLGILQLPALSALKDIIDAFPLSEVVLGITTMDNGTFRFPDMSVFQNPNIQAKNIQLPEAANGKARGFYLYGSSNLDQERTSQHLGKLLGITDGATLQAGVFVGVNPAKNSELAISIDGQISSGVELKGTFGARLTDTGFAFYVDGTVTATIQGQPVRFDVVLLVVENGLFLSGDMQVLGGGTNTIDFWGLKLHDLALEAGISFEGVPSVGFSAEVDIGSIDSALALFIDTAEPTKSMVAGSISNLHVGTLISEFAGQSIDSLPSSFRDVLTDIALNGIPCFTVDWTANHDALNNYDITTIQGMFEANHTSLPDDSGQILLIVNKPDERWFVTDESKMLHYQLLRQGDKINVSLEPQLYIVPDPGGTTIGSTTFPQGFHAFADMELWFIHDRIQFEILPPKGIGVDFEISPITIGSSWLFRLTGAGGNGGPHLVLCTFTDANNPNVNFRSPQFKLSAEANILGLTFDTDVDIDNHGFHLAISDSSMWSGFSINADFNSVTNFGAKATALVGVQSVDLGLLGTIHIDSDVTADIALGYQAPTASASADLTFEVLGCRFNIPSVSLDVNSASLKNLPDTILQAIKDFFTSLFKNVKQWLMCVFQGIVQGFENDVKALARVLSDIFKLTYKDAAKLLKDVGYAADRVLQILENGFGIAVEDAEELVNFLFNELTNCALTQALRAAASA